MKNLSLRDRKPCLIIGSQGTGKTLKFYEILDSHYPNKIIIKDFTGVRYANKTLLEFEYDVLAVDEITTTEQITYLAKLHKRLHLVIASQLIKDQIPQDLLAFFEVINMDEVTTIKKPVIL
jgi:hypothetical protein